MVSGEERRRHLDRDKLAALRTIGGSALLPNLSQTSIHASQQILGVCHSARTKF
jgi:hypothetical protein